jgi:hypothetical protein
MERSRTLMLCIGYLDTYCIAYSVTNSKHSALLRRVYKFCVRAAVTSCKSSEPIIHPHIKSRSFLIEDFKNLKIVAVPWIGNCKSVLFTSAVSTVFEGDQQH